MSAIVVYQPQHHEQHLTNLTDAEMDDATDVTRPTDSTWASNDLPFSEEESTASVPQLLEEDVDSNEIDIDTAIDETIMDDVGEQEESHDRARYGGLSNLGNTCYMASALQMLASLDDFIAELRHHEPRDTSNHRLKLRQAFLDLQERLANGETVRPVNFKETLDERTQLFLGYFQQDSHEFFTKLLDLLDEDYKKSSAVETGAENKSVEISDSCEVSVARNKTDQEGDVVDYMDTELEIRQGVSSSASCQSFSELGVNEISQLLHGSPTSREALVFPPNQPVTQPRCKLVGGRMNTADHVLTPYKERDVVAVTSSSTSSTFDALHDDANRHNASETLSCCSPVDSFFKTEVSVRLTCDSCKYTRTHMETFLHLSLEIGSECCSVEEGLRRFFAPERRDIKCEKCFCETATQNMEIVKLPRALLLHFKRFLVDVSSDYMSVSYRKNQSEVVFDEKLGFTEEHDVLSEYLSASCAEPSSLSKRYSIRSVVNHIGSSASCGHYTADSKRCGSDGCRVWKRFNDSYVSDITAREAMIESRRTAYMVLYELE